MHVKVDGVVGIDLTNGLVDAMVEVDKTSVVGISRLIQGVVTSDPSVVFVMLGEFLPEPDDTVLVIFVEPKSGDMDA